MNVHRRPRQRRSLTAAAVVALAAGAVIAATTDAPAMPLTRCQVAGPEQRTARRTFVLRTLAAERIFTRAEAATAKPTHYGEVILRSALTPAARAASPSQTHVSV